MQVFTHTHAHLRVLVNFMYKCTYTQNFKKRNAYIGSKSLGENTGVVKPQTHHGEP